MSLKLDEYSEPVFLFQPIHRLACGIRHSSCLPVYLNVGEFVLVAQSVFVGCKVIPRLAANEVFFKIQLDIFLDTLILKMFF